jgi:hypothetical protein
MPMPWIVEEEVRRYVPRERPPPFTPDPDAPWPDPKGAALYRRWRNEMMIWWKRNVAEFYEIYEFCPRVMCRRGHACVQTEAACHDEAFHILKEKVYPQIMRALRAAPTEPE